MPRKPRNYLETNFFHIINQGINKEYIFNNDFNKKEYLKILFEQKEKYGLDIISFAIMDNHFHLLIYAKEIKELSNYMKAVNEIYAMIYNKINDRLGPVFRDRFKSEPIYDERYLFQCILYIHRNPVKAGIASEIGEYKFASTVEYSLNKISKILNKDIKQIELQENVEFIDVKEEQTTKEINEICDKIIIDIKNKLKIQKIDKKDVFVIKYIIKEIRQRTGASMQFIAKYLSVSKSTVHKYINMKDE